MIDFIVNQASHFFDFNQGNVFEVLLILMAIVWASGNLFRKFKLPLMLGELLAGILIGPAVLGLVESNEVVKTFAELGVFFMLLHSGLESDPLKLVKNSHFSVLIAGGSILSSFLLGYAACRYLDFTHEASLFVGMTISFTSIAIVHNTVKGLKIQKTKVGQILQSTTIINDLLAFLLFSVVLNLLKQGEFNFLVLLWVIAKVLLFFAVTLSLGYKLLPKFNKVFNTEGMKGFTFTLVVALFFGLIAEKIGLHVILGAYLAGIFISQNVGDEKLYNKIEDRIFGLSYSFLGPIFFASIGLHISFDVLFSKNIFIFLAILGIAVFSKFVVGFVIGSFNKKLSRREAASIGIGLIARGEMVLILANLGFGQIIQDGQKTILDETLFSSLILTVFCTTLIMPLALKFLMGFKGNKITKNYFLVS